MHEQREVDDDTGLAAAKTPSSSSSSSSCSRFSARVRETHLTESTLLFLLWFAAGQQNASFMHRETNCKLGVLRRHAGDQTALLLQYTTAMVMMMMKKPSFFPRPLNSPDSDLKFVLTYLLLVFAYPDLHQKSAILRPQVPGQRSSVLPLLCCRSHIPLSEAKTGRSTDRDVEQSYNLQ
jgi:hypothetical protein